MTTGINQWRACLCLCLCVVWAVAFYLTCHEACHPAVATVTVNAPRGFSVLYSLDTRRSCLLTTTHKQWMRHAVHAQWVRRDAESPQLFCASMISTDEILTSCLHAIFTHAGHRCTGDLLCAQSGCGYMQGASECGTCGGKRASDLLLLIM